MTIAGLVLARQRSGSAKGVIFTPEDETGVANAIVWPKTSRNTAPSSWALGSSRSGGKLQSQSG